MEAEKMLLVDKLARLVESNKELVELLETPSPRGGPRKVTGSDRCRVRMRKMRLP
jgi:hypothetical protein